MKSQPLRVLELRTVRGTGGGPDKTILLGTARTDAAKYQVTICYVRDARDKVFNIDERARTLPVSYVEVIERHSFDWRIWPALRRIVREREIDIIHGHDYKTNLLALLLARAEGNHRGVDGARLGREGAAGAALLFPVRSLATALLRSRCCRVR
jgi:hypothetical protein